MTAYYNEIDPKAAAWLRELIAKNLIAPGEVDERDIQDISPADLRGFDQCHFFAGIGVWSYALRRAGWPDDRPVWTGSCPCQPFSAAGKGGGFDDERHLWPAFHYLIEQCRPPVVFGEQVASKDGLGWLDLVQADLEGTGYASGAIDLCAAGVGAPHIRQRLWWVGERLEHASRDGRVERRAEPSERGIASRRSTVRMADGDMQRQRPAGDAARAGDAAGVGEIIGLAHADGRNAGAEWEQRSGEQRQQPQDGGASGLADTAKPRRKSWRWDSEPSDGRRAPRVEPGRLHPASGLDHPTGSRHPSPGSGQSGEPEGGQCLSGVGCEVRDPSPTNGLWRDADWLFCRDGKWRPVEPGTFPLAHGAPARVGRLRGYGNAINAEAAAAFVQAYLDTH